MNRILLHGLAMLRSGWRRGGPNGGRRRARQRRAAHGSHPAF